MTEPVRLVIWDLDETFWRGTLTEGGLTYVPAHHEIVIELARRGIISSICSKNDFAAVKPVLEQHGIWEYFVFPRINWNPKGPRIASIIESFQLRAATVLFIDDNALNRNEALHLIPDIQVSDETIIADLLKLPALQGKSDHDFTRLNQYKLLARRKQDECSTSDNSEFLRSCQITVDVVHEVEPHYDRIIELINRTNQLNFTKVRLPEDLGEARAALHELLSQTGIQVGLVRAKDRYGDYGFIGVYVFYRFAQFSKAIHFCFSCRTLGMSIETWIYEKFGRPDIHVQGDVLVDLKAPHSPIDWINNPHSMQDKDETVSAGKILIRGGCDLSTMSHYFNLDFGEVICEFNTVRDGVQLRLDHPSYLVNALNGVSEDVLRSVQPLGLTAEDFLTRIADDGPGFDAYVMSFQLASNHAIYTHRQSGLSIPFDMPSVLDHSLDARTFFAQHPEIVPDEKARHLAAFLNENFDYNLPSMERFTLDLRLILSRIPTNSYVFLMLAVEQMKGHDGTIVPVHHFIAFNNVIRSVSKNRPNTILIQPAEFFESAEDNVDGVHFGRAVYYRMYKYILSKLEIRNQENSDVYDPQHVGALAE